MRARSAVLAAVIACVALSGTAAAGPALLYDATTRQVLYAEDADHPWYPASLTKMMTAYVVFEAWKTRKVDRTGTITISAHANSRPKMRLGLGAGKTLTWDEAMAALILLSANDIAVALAEAVSGTEAAFVEQMNATAARLGMAGTRFVNANGLPGEGQHVTPRDLATLTQALLIDFPEHAGLFSLMEAPVGPRKVHTHNPVVMKLSGGNGMKTGFTCSAAYNIVGSATREGITLVAIVLGEENPAKREARTMALLEHGFRTLEWKALFPPVTLDTLPVEPFDAEQVRQANLAKRYKDCRAPEPPLDENGNPICPEIKEVKGARSARAVAITRAIRAKGITGEVATTCLRLAMIQLKAPPQKPTKAARPGARAVAKRAPRPVGAGTSGVVTYGANFQ